MSRTLQRSSDYIAELSAQKNAAIRLFGADPGASALAGASRPYTPPEYAKLVYFDYGDGYHASCSRELSSSCPLASTFLNDARASKRLLRRSELDEMRAIGLSLCDGVPSLTIDMTNGLQKSADNGIGLGSTLTGVRNSAGVLCLNAGNCVGFWDGLQRYTIAAGATGAVVTSAQRWDAFVDGLSQSADDVADAIGGAAAKVLEKTGESLGAGVGGFLGELGVVNSVIVMGVGFVAFKFL